MIGKAIKYHGKILLFGEYTVVMGGSSLAMPLDRFSASWTYNEKVDSQLIALGEHLQHIPVNFKYHMFREAIHKGLNFQSDIPQGYGCGSSGALIAAIYGDFCEHAQSISLKDLQFTLGMMESFFHGKSSGIDPLVIYLNKVISTQKGKAKIIEVSAKTIMQNWYLLDSGISRFTSHLFNEFKHRLNIDAVYKRNVTQIQDLNDTIINQLCTNQNLDLTLAIRELSQKQLTCFSEFIPEHVFNIWKYGLESKEYAVKLCGAGGGGYFLVYGKIKDVETISLSGI